MSRAGKNIVLRFYFNISLEFNKFQLNGMNIFPSSTIQWQKEPEAKWAQSVSLICHFIQNLP